MDWAPHLYQFFTAFLATCGLNAPRLVSFLIFLVKNPGSSTQFSPAQPASSLPDIDDFPGFSNDASDVSSSQPSGIPWATSLWMSTRSLFLSLRWAQGAVATNALRGWHFEQ